MKDKNGNNFNGNIVPIESIVEKQSIETEKNQIKQIVRIKSTGFTLKLTKSIIADLPSRDIVVIEAERKQNSNKNTTKSRENGQSKLFQKENRVKFVRCRHRTNEKLINNLEVNNDNWMKNFKNLSKLSDLPSETVKSIDLKQSRLEPIDDSNLFRFPIIDKKKSTENLKMLKKNQTKTKILEPNMSLPEHHKTAPKVEKTRLKKLDFKTQSKMIKITKRQEQREQLKQSKMIDTTDFVREEDDGCQKKDNPIQSNQFFTDDFINTNSMLNFVDVDDDDNDLDGLADENRFDSAYNSFMANHKNISERRKDCFDGARGGLNNLIPRSSSSPRISPNLNESMSKNISKFFTLIPEPLSQRNKNKLKLVLNDYDRMKTFHSSKFSKLSKQFRFNKLRSDTKIFKIKRKRTRPFRRRSNVTTKSPIEKTVRWTSTKFQKSSKPNHSSVEGSKQSKRFDSREYRSIDSYESL
ncbi:hypothetical protein NH340_JMT01483 [Sarcoptes scabiei]|nr:hypothetical protein NH340_JMT01483 [Sarcoptes scabiei]